VISLVFQIEASCPVLHRAKLFLQSKPKSPHVDQELPDQIFMGILDSHSLKSICIRAKMKQAASSRSGLLDC